MTESWLFTALMLVALVVMWRAARFVRIRLAQRRHGVLMTRMDWTREPPQRRIPAKKGLLEQILR